MCTLLKFELGSHRLEEGGASPGLLLPWRCVVKHSEFDESSLRPFKEIDKMKDCRQDTGVLHNETLISVFLEKRFRRMSFPDFTRHQKNL